MRKKKKRIPLILPILMVGVAVIALFFLWPRGDVSIPVAVTDPLLIATDGDGVIKVKNDWIYTYDKKGEETMAAKLPLAPVWLYRDNKDIVVADKARMAVLDAKGEVKSEASFGQDVSYVRVEDGTALVFGETLLFTYDMKAERTGIYSTTDALLQAHVQEGSLYVTDVAKDLPTRSTLYEAKEGALQTVWPQLGDVILDFASTKGGVAVFTRTQATFLPKESPARTVPLTHYAGSSAKEPLLVLDDTRLIEFTPAGDAERSFDFTVPYPHLLGTKNGAVAWSDNAYGIVEGEEVHEGTFDAPIVDIRVDGERISILFADHILQTNAGKLMKE